MDKTHEKIQIISMEGVDVYEVLDWELSSGGVLWLLYPDNSEMYLAPGYWYRVSSLEM